MGSRPYRHTIQSGHTGHRYPLGMTALLQVLQGLALELQHLVSTPPATPAGSTGQLVLSAVSTGGAAAASITSSVIVSGSTQLPVPPGSVINVDTGGTSGSSPVGWFTLGAAVVAATAAIWADILTRRR